ncbi:hypothetical protein A7985_25050 [Pseudoalteromonas luteoviolacea]|uniref:SEC-C domain-containing protein n=1 Tax=Pseudoalteromonas luteoviolacea TaxID=43657 RepID=A0A1C0TIQ5_9GAMM|nr:hypothetical protein [Pseudoalteromonas luteoviolacea]OCQ17947.1 hypothetical protein A7985_25050 [Pseudoalteromonas luteoviolacea]
MNLCPNHGIVLEATLKIKGLERFFKENPLMGYGPVTHDGEIRLNGKVELNHSYENYPAVQQLIDLKIIIPSGYPNTQPEFEEVGGFVPRIDEFHINPSGTLCLGSPFRIDKYLRVNSDFLEFFNAFFIPYIYAVALKKDHGINFVFGELKHGSEGELEDFASEIGLTNKEELIACAHALSQKKRIANKGPCPCNCGLRLGKCELHLQLNKLRKTLPRKWYRNFKARL